MRARPSPDHQQRDHRQQRRIGKPRQQAGRIEDVGARGIEDRVEMEEDQQNADHAQRCQLQRDALKRVEDQRHQNDGKGQPHTQF